ncbi:MAG: phosphatase PAP2 family protein [Pirellulaceae bacterium]|nr:hypothetical protein [Planctomycetales bacterium]
MLVRFRSSQSDKEMRQEVVDDESQPGSLRAWLDSHIVAIVLLASWILPATRVYWDQFDTWVFRRLNGTLSSGGQWLKICAIMNHRMFDLVPAVLLFGLVWHWIHRVPQPARVRRFATAVILALAVLLTRTATTAVVHGPTLTYHRASPSLVIEESISVEGAVDGVAAKGSSPYSFPGDHGFVLISVVMFFVFHQAYGHAVLAAVYAVVFAMPRLIAGGHWFTDIAIGSLVMSLICTSWLYATPLNGLLQMVVVPVVIFVDRGGRMLFRSVMTILRRTHDGAQRVAERVSERVVEETPEAKESGGRVPMMHVRTSSAGAVEQQQAPRVKAPRPNIARITESELGRPLS